MCIRDSPKHTVMNALFCFLRSGGSQTSHRLVGSGQKTAVIMIGKLIHCRKTVSYTHLDVYKRQPPLPPGLPQQSRDFLFYQYKPFLLQSGKKFPSSCLSVLCSLFMQLTSILYQNPNKKPTIFFPAVQNSAPFLYTGSNASHAQSVSFSPLGQRKPCL